MQQKNGQESNENYNRINIQLILPETQLLCVSFDVPDLLK